MLQYLGRYTHRTAIANHRLLSVSNEAVRFRYRDYQDNNQQKVMTLAPQEFIRRFIQHVLPSGFMRIRAFGFLANAAKKKMLPKIKRLLHRKNNGDPPKKLTVNAFLLNTLGIDITRCPKCHVGNWLTVKVLPTKFGSTMWDTS